MALSTTNIPGGKGGRCVRLTSPPSLAECHEIWEPKPPVTLWATPGLLRDSLAFFYILLMTVEYGGDLGSGLHLRKPTFRCLWPLTDVFRLKYIGPKCKRVCVCEVTHVFCVVVCVLTAAHKFELRIVINETPNKRRPVVSTSRNNNGLYFW
jgi:hypothetical protein